MNEKFHLPTLLAIGGSMSVIAAAALFSLPIFFRSSEATFSEPNPTLNLICQQEGVVVFQNTVLLCGPITSGSILPIMNLESKSIEKIVVNSSGGQSKAAIDLARKINQSGWQLRVSGLCLSACAHFLLPSADVVEVVHPSFIGFHHTFSSADMVTKKFLEVKQTPFSEGAIAESAFYREMGIDERFLVAPYLILEKEVLMIDPSGDETTFGSTKYSNASFLNLPNSVLERIFKIEIRVSNEDYGEKTNETITLPSGSKMSFVADIDLDASEHPFNRLKLVCVGEAKSLDGLGSQVAFNPRKCVASAELQ